MALVPQNNVALPAVLTASVNSLTIEQAHPGETFNMVVRDAMSGFVFFNIEGNLHYDASTQLLGIQDGRLLISKALASNLGRARDVDRGSVSSEHSLLVLAPVRLGRRKEWFEIALLGPAHDRQSATRHSRPD